MRGWRKRRRSRHPRARRRRVRRKTEAGSPGPRGSGRHERDVASERCRGQRTSREASGRSWLSREATSLAACVHARTVHSTGPVAPNRLRSARKGGREPVRRSARRRRSIAASATRKRGPERHPEARRRPKPTWPQGSPDVSNDAGLTARARRATGSVTNRTFIGGRP